ncbi:hypothetical protein HY213_05520 [Candidatus Peregrinibacteria bacterium]|nr:hypothetical protein [Candidatus Peregrinibacteria bacterium]
MRNSLLRTGIDGREHRLVHFQAPEKPPAAMSESAGDLLALYARQRSAIKNSLANEPQNPANLAAANREKERILQKEERIDAMVRPSLDSLERNNNDLKDEAEGIYIGELASIQSSTAAANPVAEIEGAALQPDATTLAVAANIPQEPEPSTVAENETPPTTPAQERVPDAGDAVAKEKGTLPMRILEVQGQRGAYKISADTTQPIRLRFLAVGGPDTVDVLQPPSKDASGAQATDGWMSYEADDGEISLVDDENGKQSTTDIEKISADGDGFRIQTSPSFRGIIVTEAVGRKRGFVGVGVDQETIDSLLPIIFESETMPTREREQTATASAITRNIANVRQTVKDLGAGM